MLWSCKESFLFDFYAKVCNWLVHWILKLSVFFYLFSSLKVYFFRDICIFDKKKEKNLINYIFDKRVIIIIFDRQDWKILFNQTLNLLISWILNIAIKEKYLGPLKIKNAWFSLFFLQCMTLCIWKKLGNICVGPWLESSTSFHLFIVRLSFILLFTLLSLMTRNWMP